MCDGSEEENELMLRKMVQSGTLVQVNPEIRPNSYVARSEVSDGLNLKNCLLKLIPKLSRES